MKTASTKAKRHECIWTRAVDFDKELSPAAARALLRVRFAASEHKRAGELLGRSRTARLKPQEEEALDTYELLGTLLGILHSKARQALKKHAAGA
jgi:hypothetical protein